MLSRGLGPGHLGFPKPPSDSGASRNWGAWAPGLVSPFHSFRSRHPHSSLGLFSHSKYRHHHDACCLKPFGSPRIGQFGAPLRILSVLPLISAIAVMPGSQQVCLWFAGFPCRFGPASQAGATCPEPRACLGPPPTRSFLDCAVSSPEAREELLPHRAAAADGRWSLCVSASHSLPAQSAVAAPREGAAWPGTRSPHPLLVPGPHSPS